MPLLNTRGKLSMLRVHDVSSKYGPPSDQIDVEVVITLVGNKTNAFGFQLRNNTNMAAHQGMLDILRDAFNNNWFVNIDYSIATGKKNGVILRAWLTK